MKKKSNSSIKTGIQAGLVSSLVATGVSLVVNEARAKKRAEENAAEAWAAVTRSKKIPGGISPEDLIKHLGMAITTVDERVDSLEDLFYEFKIAHKELVNNVEDLEKTLHTYVGNFESVEELKERLDTINKWSKEIFDQYEKDQGMKVDALAFEKKEGESPKVTKTQVKIPPKPGTDSK